MPELPDIMVYVDGLRHRVVDQPLQAARIGSPFLVRTFEPPIDDAIGQPVIDVRRLGKRIILCLPGELFLVFHLMIAGRFRWQKCGSKPLAKIGLAAFDFPTGTLTLTEAGKQKRASLHVVRGEASLREHDPGGVDVLSVALAAFSATLRRENHTLKRCLTDPRLFDGIGNAYSDEILHAARLSPIALSQKLGDDEVARLHSATQRVLRHWIDKLHAEFADRFPGAGDITAFRPDFAVHGRFGQPCPDCGSPVQRIRYAENESNYCAKCQTAGRVLADRSLSRLLKDDWPRTL
ncbi:MAG: formamidopyrimidine-DNA glycosylase [Phycisphaerae bacterium]|nr:formamidopyrimidine-DNA glycosylase [Phycisphaerae bacterium]